MLWENTPPYAIVLLYLLNVKCEERWVQCCPFPCRVSLFRAVFCSFEQCAGELSLPVHLRGVQRKGQVEVAVTLYQHVCVHLCAFITSFPPSLFPELVSSSTAGPHPGRPSAFHRNAGFCTEERSSECVFFSNVVLSVCTFSPLIQLCLRKW